MTGRECEKSGVAARGDGGEDRKERKNRGQKQEGLSKKPRVWDTGRELAACKLFWG